MKLIEDIRLIYDNYTFATDIWRACPPIHILEGCEVGADDDRAAVSHQVVVQSCYRQGHCIAGFVADWEKTGQSIL